MIILNIQNAVHVQSGHSWILVNPELYFFAISQNTRELEAAEFQVLFDNRNPPIRHTYFCQCVQALMVFNLQSQYMRMWKRSLWLSGKQHISPSMPFIFKMGTALYRLQWHGKRWRIHKQNVHAAQTLIAFSWYMAYKLQ